MFPEQYEPADMRSILSRRIGLSCCHIFLVGMSQCAAPSQNAPAGHIAHALILCWLTLYPYFPLDKVVCAQVHCSSSRARTPANIGFNKRIEEDHDSTDDPKKNRLHNQAIFLRRQSHTLNRHCNANRNRSHPHTFRMAEMGLCLENG